MDFTKLTSRLTPGMWRSAFFYLIAMSTFLVLSWQLWELEPPTKFCPVDNLSICWAAITTVLNIKDHAILGLLSILGMVIIGSMVATYNVNIHAQGGIAQGFNVEVHQDKTTVTTAAGTVNVPTVPVPPVEGI